MKRWWLILVLAAAPAGAQEIYDLLIKNGHVIDPKNARNERLDIAVRGDRIVKVGRNLPPAQARNVIDADGYYVTPGLIDIHTHFDAQGAWLNLNPDHNALRHGVTTAVDAGSSGWKNFEQFKRRVIDHAETRLLAFLNIVGAGMYGAEVENDVREMDVEAAARMVKRYPDVIVGIKTAHYQPADWEAVDRAVKAAELSGTVVMVDFHPKPGRGYREPRAHAARRHSHALLRPADAATRRGEKAPALHVGGAPARRPLRRGPRLRQFLVPYRRSGRAAGLLAGYDFDRPAQRQRHVARGDADQCDV